MIHKFEDFFFLIENKIKTIHKKTHTIYLKKLSNVICYIKIMIQYIFYLFINKNYLCDVFIYIYIYIYI